MSDTLANESLEGLDDTPAAGGQRRLLLLVGAAAAVLVLGLAGYFLFLSGGGEEDLDPVPQSAPAPADTKEKGDKKGGKDDTTPAQVDDDFQVGQDPFQPLAVEAVAAPPAEEPVDDVGTDTADTGSTGGDISTPAPVPTVTVTAEPKPTEEPVTYKVKLISVDLVKKKATIEVDGKRYLLAVKDMFPSSKTGPFQLTGVGEAGSGKATATVVFGAEAPVELIEQDAVTFKN
jgi:hypothetical protein